MIRRSRISVRPNVSTVGRTGALATPQDAHPLNQEANDIQAEVNEENTAALTNKCIVSPLGTTTTPGDTNDQSGEGTISSAAVQRRKRFSIKPKVNPGRTCASVRTPKSPVKAISESPVQDLDKSTTSSQTETTVPQGLRSPSRRRPSGESRQPKTQPKPTLPSPTSPGPTAVPPDEDPLEHAQLPADESKKLQGLPGSHTRGVPPKPPDKVPPSLPEKEAIEISERAKTLVSRSAKSGLSLPPPTFSLSRLLNDPSDLQRLAKARKLRELLRQEVHKEKRLKKAKANAKEYTADPAKMTMRDLIYYLPISNPMTSYFEESMQGNETVVPPSPAREESPERAQEPEVLPEMASQREEDDGEADEDQGEQLMVPRVKVAEDGSLIIDEESLTVEVLRAKGPNPAEGRDPIFERGSTTTYSSFRKGSYTKPWSSEETDMFFLAISMVGTDFSMICQLFPHRARSEIKNKFKKEERENAWRIDKAFKERHKLDLEVFSKLLEKVLEVRNRKKKKPKSTEPTEKKAIKKHNRKAKEKKAEKKLSDIEEDEEEEEEEEEEEKNRAPDLEEVEGEKENEDISNEGGTSASTAKRKYKRKKREESLTEEQMDKKMKTGKKNNQGEACVPEDAEAALPEDHTAVNKSEKSESVGAAMGTTIKPAQLSRGRAPKPLLPLGRKWGKRGPTPSTKPKDGVPDAGEESLGEGASKDQVDKNASPSRPAKKKKLADDDISSESEEDSTVAPPKATSYGRIPKPIQHLNYPAKEGACSSASETIPGSASPVGSTTSAAKPKPKPKHPAKKARSSKTQLAQESKKPKLVTLRASQLEYSDEEDEKQREAEEMEEQHNPSSANKDSNAPVFVPMSLRSPHPVVSEVEETMEELDILVNVPDVLGISQDALCPDASCEQAQDETGTVEPCEHQLDLLVDVIDFLSSDHMEVSEEESYNEAAQTLLTIGNLTHLSQSTQNTSTQDDTTGALSIGDKETCSQDLKEEIVSKHVAEIKSSTTPPMTLTSGSIATEASQTADTVEPEISTKDNCTVSQIGDMPIVTTSDQTYSKQKTVADIEPAPQIESSSDISKQNAPQTRRGRFSKVKPNLGRASGITQSKSQPMTSPARTVKESSTVAPEFSRVTQSLPVAEESVSTVADCNPASLTDDMPSTEIKSASQENAADEGPALQVELDSVTSDQSSSQNRSRFSNAKLKPNLGQATRNTRSKSQSTNETVTSLVRIIESSFTTPSTNLADTESQVVQGSVTNTVPVQEGNDYPAATMTEEFSASQEEESKVGSVSQTRKKQFSKVKPKPNLKRTLRTAESKPQPRDDTVTHLEPMKGPSSPTSNLKSPENTMAQLEPQPFCSTTPHAKPPLSTGPASVLMRSLELGSTLTSTEEFSSSEETKTEAGQTSSECSEQNVPQKRRRFPKVKPNVGSSIRTTQSTKDVSKLSKQDDMDSSSNVSSEEQPIKDNSTHTDLKTTEKASKHLTPPHCSLKTELSSSTNAGATESERSLEENTTHKIRSFDGVGTEASWVTADSFMTDFLPDESTIEGEPTEDTTASQVKGAEVVTASQVELSIQQKFPLPESQRLTEEFSSETMTSDPVITENSWSIENVFLMFDSSSSEMATTPTEGLSTCQDIAEAGSPPQRGGDLRRSTKTTESNPQPTEDTTTISKPQSSEDCSTQANVKSTTAHYRADPKENTHQHCSESSDSIHMDDSEVKGQAAFQKCLSGNSDASQTTMDNFQAAQCADHNQSEPTDSAQSSKKAPQTRRARIPKPNLGRSSRPPRGRPVQNAAQPEPDSKPSSYIQKPIEAATVQYSDHDNSPNDAVSPLDCMTQIPVNSTQDATTPSTGGTQSYPSHTTHPDVLSEELPPDPEETFFILSLTEIPVFPSGNEEGCVSEPLPCLPVTDAPMQLQSSVATHGGSLAVGGDGALCNVLVPMSLEEGGESAFTSLKDVEPGPSVCTSSITKKPVDPHENPKTQPSKLPEAVGNSEDVEVPYKKQRLTDTGRSAQRQVKPSSSEASEASRAFTAKETELIPMQINTTSVSELPCPPVQPETIGTTAGAGDKDFTEPQKGTVGHPDVEKDTPTGGDDTEDSGSGAQTHTSHQTKRSHMTVTRNRPGRKPKGFLSFLSEKSSTTPLAGPQHAKAVSQVSKVKTSHTGRKRAAPAPTTSRTAALDVSPTPSIALLPEATHSTSTTTTVQAEVDITQISDVSPLRPHPEPSTSRCTTEVPATQQSDYVESSSVDEEPTNVSQYFLSDIFTEVDEG